MIPRGALVLVVAYSLLPFAGFLNENKDQRVGVADLVPHFLIVLVPAVLLVLAVTAWRGREAANRTAVVVAAGLFVFFHFHTVGLALGRVRIWNFPAQLLAWAAVFLAAIGIAYVLGRRPVVRRYVLAVGVALTLFSVAQYTAFRLTSDSSSASASSGESEMGGSAVRVSSTAGHRPNVYFFVLDGYGRRDQLAKHLGFDNGPFIQALSRRGFHVARRAIANYPSTHLSVSSTLDMRYLLRDEAGFEGGQERFYRRLSGSNETVRQLKRLGYRYALAPDGSWEGLQCSGIEDLCIEPRNGPGLLGKLSETDWAVLKLTPLAGTAQRLVPGGVAGPYTTPGHLVDALDERQLREPYFAFNHMVSPHPPYRWAPDCSMKDVRRLFSASWDRDEYLDNLRCVNKLMTSAVDRVIRRDPGAIVIIQGDHGSAFTVDVEQKASDWTPDEIRERFPVLSAIRLPARCRDSLHDAMTLVNTFRTVLACLRGEEPTLLEDRAYVARYPEHGVMRVSRELVRGRLFER